MFDLFELANASYNWSCGFHLIITLKLMIFKWLNKNITNSPWLNETSFEEAIFCKMVHLVILNGFLREFGMKMQIFRIYLSISDCLTIFVYFFWIFVWKVRTIVSRINYLEKKNKRCYCWMTLNHDLAPFMNIKWNFEQNIWELIKILLIINQSVLSSVLSHVFIVRSF